ncbi:carbon catabolite repressor protein 4 homolog 5-like [Arachis stenosperma]|uniref:carbon catabolite repressor protein 4 homolog 5-like n=1 Tax=Arachis stenosperma TaxID=217475 RepID=UPI0025AB7A12|nr:carbon catabolite repressor protein 4 homolog 5-like [Arachis stenosperma]
MIPVKISEQSPRVSFYDEVGNIQGHKEELELLPEIREQAQIREAALKQRMTNRYNKKVIRRSFTPDDLVLIRNDIGVNKSGDGKLAANWKGPYKIREVFGKGYYKVTDLNGTKLPSCPKIFEKNAQNDKPESETSGLTTVTSSTERKRSVIGNIHVLFNPNRGDIKLGQVRLLLDKAYKLSEEWGSIPVIIAGDLNSLPQSAIYEFLASSKLDIQLHNRKNMSGQLEIQSNSRVFRSQIGYEASISISHSRQFLHGWTMEELNLATGTIGAANLQHHLNLRSAYSSVPGNHGTRDDIGEPLATSYHSKFMGTVDYIWHSEELTPVRVLETLTIDILRRTGLPSELFHHKEAYH